MHDIINNYYFCDHDRVRIVPTLGPFTEQTGSTPPVNYASTGKACMESLIMAFEMSSSQQVDVSVEFRDKKGNKAKVDGVPEWLVDNSEVLALTPSGDGMSCTVAAAGPLGVGIITLTGDADLGTGVVPVIGTLEVSITAGPAVNVELTPGVPQEQ